MCYYARTDYRCGDWRWGNMKLRCPRQHRMGETCGAKLVHTESITRSPELCKICQEMAIKERRLKKEQDNIERWSKDGTKFSASIEKAQREAQQLVETLTQLHNRRPQILMQTRQGMSPPGPDLGFSNSQGQGARGVSGTSHQAPYNTTPGPAYPNTSQGQHDRHTDYPPGAVYPSGTGYPSAPPMGNNAYYSGTGTNDGYSMPQAHPYPGRR